MEEKRADEKRGKRETGEERERRDAVLSCLCCMLWCWYLIYNHLSLSLSLPLPPPFLPSAAPLPPRYALKSINLAAVDSQQVAELKNEVALLKMLDHPNITHLYETYVCVCVCVC